MQSNCSQKEVVMETNEWELLKLGDFIGRTGKAGRIYFPIQLWVSHSPIFQPQDKTFMGTHWR